MGIFQPQIQSGERRSQVMGYVAANLAQTLHQDADPVEHMIQRAGKAVEIVARSPNWNTLRQITLDNCICRDCDGIHSRKKGQAEQNPATKTEDGRQTHCPRRRPRRLPLPLLKPGISRPPPRAIALRRDGSPTHARVQVVPPCPALPLQVSRPDLALVRSAAISPASRMPPSC